MLVALTEEYGQPLPNKGVIIGVDLTRIELGTMVGYTGIAAQRALSQLRDQGIIDPIAANRSCATYKRSASWRTREGCRCAIASIPAHDASSGQLRERATLRRYDFSFAY
ncbi:winged helix-turn-helix domain-containing protein [Actinospica sp. MGRD01-02]|uniref:Winged helix-turn-helix domain-containing protein n=1 Tax=Actinospica acidithermotolerans TaxID=2828514 RepID=A0A941EAE9_9ACTN|nr:helix-turn-helix domain-containing protein [Actinospica acidithermotolerans]MBR7827926.1 winged helix-turn-helix domain-containing protein [Actinospica acidithermotolerans]